MNEQLNFLDLLTLLSFVLQVQNQTNIVGLRDVQREVNRAVEEIHAHLETQDQKIDEILRTMRENDEKD